MRKDYRIAAIGTFGSFAFFFQVCLMVLGGKYGIGIYQIPFVTGFGLSIGMCLTALFETTYE